MRVSPSPRREGAARAAGWRPGALVGSDGLSGHCLDTQLQCTVPVSRVDPGFPSAKLRLACAMRGVRSDMVVIWERGWCTSDGSGRGLSCQADRERPQESQLCLASLGPCSASGGWGRWRLGPIFSRGRPREVRLTPPLMIQLVFPRAHPGSSGRMDAA